MIRSETNEKIDLEGHYPKTLFHIALFRMELRSHCTFFQSRISAIPEIRADLFLAISKTGMCWLTLSYFKAAYSVTFNLLILKTMFLFFKNTVKILKFR